MTIARTRIVAGDGAHGILMLTHPSHPSLGSSDLAEPPPSPTCHFTCLCEDLIAISPPLFYFANAYVVLTMYQALNALEIVIHLVSKNNHEDAVIIPILHRETEGPCPRSQS